MSTVEPEKAAPMTNDPGWSGRDDKGRQQCDTCGKWQFPVIHSCCGVWGGSARFAGTGEYLDGRGTRTVAGESGGSR